MSVDLTPETMPNFQLVQGYIDVTKYGACMVKNALPAVEVSNIRTVAEHFKFDPDDRKFFGVHKKSDYVFDQLAEASPTLVEWVQMLPWVFDDPRLQHSFEVRLRTHNNNNSHTDFNSRKWALPGVRTTFPLSDVPTRFEFLHAESGVWHDFTFGMTEAGMIVESPRFSLRYEEKGKTYKIPHPGHVAKTNFGHKRLMLLHDTFSIKPLNLDRLRAWSAFCAADAA